MMPGLVPGICFWGGHPSAARERDGHKRILPASSLMIAATAFVALRIYCYSFAIKYKSAAGCAAAALLRNGTPHDH